MKGQPLQLLCEKNLKSRTNKTFLKGIGIDSKNTWRRKIERWRDDRGKKERNGKREKSKEYVMPLYKSLTGVTIFLKSKLSKNQRIEETNIHNINILMQTKTKKDFI